MSARSKMALLQQTFIDYKNIVKQIQMLGNETEGQENAQLMITELKNGENAKFTISQYCVKGVVEELISGSWQQIQLNRFFSRFLPTYSNIKLMSNMDEVNNLLFNNFPWGNKQEKQEAEPTPLIVDSLLPISADIDEENVYKKNNSKKIVFNEDDILAKSKAKERTESQERKIKYTKLQITEISEEDGFTKELRKINEEKNKKLENERAAFEKKQQLRLEKLKDKNKKKGQREDKFCYDYNGNVFEVRMQSKANLVSKVINGLTNSNAKIVKEVIHDPNPIQVEPTNGKSKKLALLMSPKRKDDVQFSQMKSLADNIQTRVGVKYTYEGKTYQEKTKPIPAAELRKTLSQRKISKEDYKRVRDLNGNKNDYEENMKKPKVKEEGKHQRAYSQAKYSDSRLTNRKKEKIHVSSNELKGKLLQKIPQVTYEQLPPQSRQETPANRLGHIDSFNLQYLRSGGSLHASTSKQFYSQRSNNQLPKITHTTLYSKMLPKGRQRIKDANQIIRDLRKKFEEKLRV